MKRYYSAEIGGFFDPDIIGAPEDAKEIEESVYQSMVGMSVTSDENGFPSLIDHTPEDLALTDYRSRRRALDDKLNSLTYDFGDGRVIQTRPEDEANFERAYKVIAITGAESIGWVMADNVKHEVTLQELETAHNHGLVAGAILWDEFS